MFEGDDTHRLDAALRALATAGKSLRLYPASSPIPMQSVEAAVASLGEFFADGHPLLSLSVTREGFLWRSTPVGGSALGTSELVNDLRDHGVAEITLMPGCSAESLVSFLASIAREPEAVRAEGGIGAVLAAAGVNEVAVSEVQLTVIEQVGPEEGENVEDFLRELAQDPEKLAAWFAAAAAGDPRAFEESLMELVRVSGPSGFPKMLDSLARAFLSQDPEAKDALLGLSMDPGPTRDLTGGMFSLLASGDIAGSILGGNFGRNMLSLSSALTRLPLEQVTAQVRAEVQAMLPGTGHTSKEADFLDHMIEVRERAEPETPLVDSDRTYRAVLEAAALSDDLIERARGAVIGSEGALTSASVRTMLSLLDQQRSFDLMSASIDAIANVVPRLVEQGDLELADTVLTRLAQRELAPSEWPDLPLRIREALTRAAGPRTMGALVRTLVADRTLLARARGIVRHAGEDGVTTLVTEALAHKAEGLEVAEELIGRRIIDELGRVATATPWYQLGPLTARLARESDPRSQGVIDALMRRDEQSRKEVVNGLAATPGPLSTRALGIALGDSAVEVAAAAARAIGRSDDPTAAALLSERLAHLDVDNADYLLARELIAALARVPGPDADTALERLATRKALLKRGHFAEVQELVRQAKRFREQSGGER